METRTIIFGKFVLSLVFFAILWVPMSASAATLSFSPRLGSYSVGSLLAVNVYVSSANQAMNAVSATISFPKDKLQIVSISKSNSIINLWVKPPAFSDILGDVTLKGIILNPGYIGSYGKLVTIVFRVRAPGTASLIFSSASVLANDGTGTNILTGTGRTSFSFITVAPIIISQKSTTTIASSTPPIQEIIIATSTVPIIVNARQTEPFKLVFSTMDTLALLVSISALVILLILLWYYGIHKIRIVRRRIKREIQGVDVLFEKAYGVLENGIQEHVTLLRKKHRKTAYDTETETALLRLEQQLENARHIIKREEKDIEKDIEEDLS